MLAALIDLTLGDASMPEGVVERAGGGCSHQSAGWMDAVRTLFVIRKRKIPVEFPQFFFRHLSILYKEKSGDDHPKIFAFGWKTCCEVWNEKAPEQKLRHTKCSSG